MEYNVKIWNVYVSDNYIDYPRDLFPKNKEMTSAQFKQSIEDCSKYGSAYDLENMEYEIYQLQDGGYGLEFYADSNLGNISVCQISFDLLVEGLSGEEVILNLGL